MKPIVTAMDIFQSEKSYIGHIIPTIIGIQKKLHSCSEKTIKPLIQALSRGIEKRFGPVLGNEEYLLATAIIPQFKLNFLSDEQKKYLIKEKLLAYIKEMNQELEKSGLFNLYLIANVKRFFFG